ncbi:MAG: type III-A CRISPR-associated protein Csm2 [Anaerolineae bacterium]|nr:type III-A CRISPR-associated protein Csm2 [Anaerolineae bacterium]MCI0609631.1 type III-A CRISPR-associated protein Csm2 [Anaerolineae bacterium]
MTVDIATIINTENPDELVKGAKDLARQLRGDVVTKTQVRRLFASMRQIEAKWGKDLDAAYRDLVLFGPRIAYQASRDAKIAPLAKVIQEGIPLVGKERAKLKRLAQFFEATLAYFLAG